MSLTESSSDQSSYSPLEHYALLRFSGPDARSFLQGQCSIDINKIGTQGSFGCHCNAKGRVISSFYAAQVGDDIILRLHRDICDLAVLAFKKYMIFSKVELTICDELQAVAVFTDEPGPNRPALHGSITQGADIAHVHQISSTVHELWLSTEQSQKLGLQKNKLGAKLWQATLIQQGIAEIQKGQSEVFLPQELNYQLIGAVDFKKGCYTGQEVIARLHYRGQLKKHMRRIEVASSIDLNSAELCDQYGKKVGQALQTEDGSGPVQLLCLCNDEAYQKDEIYLNEARAGQQKVRWLNLPYAIP
ncbi:YgfZ/GcvT domain-containing protein [Agaribacterium haliotis]|uniref:CAF17-like 4Fe-4S cluster assembly/insertion protein YgfZ n=1 Tax=Agaribacterium haliotis TaxID=2013869 RepID=UPI000BB58E7F|nr:folate-binding protein YgfZ [Agaribacterium haliotis]